LLSCFVAWFSLNRPQYNTCVYRGTDFRNRIGLVIFEVYTEELLKITNLWPVMPYGLVNSCRSSRRFIMSHL